MFHKVILISFILIFFLGCNIFGESEIEEGFVLGPSTDGIIFWFDASTDQDIFYGVGSEVATINDKNENGNYMDCPTSRPTYMTNQLNGLGGLVASAGPNCTAYYAAVGDHFTFFVVSKITTDTASIIPLDIYTIDTSAEQVGASATFFNSGNLKDPVLITYEFDDGNDLLSVYRNLDKIVDEQAAAGTASLANSNAMVSYTLGSTIFEMVYYDRFLSNDERLGIQNYLIVKWGL